MKKIAISIGDINGIGLEILIRSHEKLSTLCTPYYFIHENLLQQALKILNLKLLNANIIAFKDSKTYEFKYEKSHNLLHVYSFCLPLGAKVDENFNIQAGKIDAKSGLYSFLSFKAASYFVYKKYAHALLTLPIHKKAWEEAKLNYKGHTDALRDFFKQNALMMLGCKELFIGLFSEHIPLAKVSQKITFKKLSIFLKDFYQQTGFKKIGVLAFNPHAGDYGVIGGKEEQIMQKSIHFVNAFLYSKKDEIFFRKALKDENLQNELLFNFKGKGVYLPYPLVADTAFTKMSLKSCKRLVAMYHDLALAPLKALYFDKSINVSLNLPILRVSVDHGTAFDKAYNNAKISTKSYFEAAKFALQSPIKTSI
ncbi:4-hydroxythreonine-4-phosphate dehydrogenase [Campylobacter hepaticus]|uniref:4-hydroxythreonine-4-phosphate dehydrogenase n=1 Tax=Campylobacter hepaticus TaxID=1813019 RepID=A0A6A7JQX9_9BACT|nr:4-hydroxythreonine-4-phosphate dehydrogenase [Campylobacter hepaticus]AXP08291.1 4-hydroxythreonine-4-phosphate dehydrogenase [Campylobacter hepaticus]MCZ0772113.1 4-hydroxythreonine-4-phosphate dehydrogenase [Campylobacter hepaticus]MCZ0773582.1 4-hydroxythreonine-4-phosphate dehydrogenase [Campylobacter hepaticus]MCZ0774832.1 4-hydroxythreonine-4-phosphate dehydrogenase [Campylobacter hepaticus]MDX2322712.1 4-hydroxythreonine-4-phosphate dehydrogenase [Campylobacter hepaticus]